MCRSIRYVIIATIGYIFSAFLSISAMKIITSVCYVIISSTALTIACFTWNNKSLIRPLVQLS